MKKAFDWLMAIICSFVVLPVLLPTENASAACGGPFCIYDTNRLDVSMSVGETRTFYFDESLSYFFQTFHDVCNVRLWDGGETVSYNYLNIEVVDVNAHGRSFVTDDGILIDSRPSMVLISPSKMSNVCQNGHPSFTITALEEGVAVIEVTHATWNDYSPNKQDGYDESHWLASDYLIQVKISPNSSGAADSDIRVPDTTSNESNPGLHVPDTAGDTSDVRVPNTIGKSPSIASNATSEKPSSISNGSSGGNTSSSTPIADIQFDNTEDQVRLGQQLLNDTKEGDRFPIILGKTSTLTKGVLQLLQPNDRRIVVTKFNGDNKTLYEWEFDSKDIDATKDLNLGINFNSSYRDDITRRIQELVVDDAGNVDTTYLSFAQSGDFPISAKVKIGVKVSDGASVVHLYRYNNEVKELEIVQENITVRDGQAELSITNGARDYVVTSKRINIKQGVGVVEEEKSKDENSWVLPVIISLAIILVVGTLGVSSLWWLKHKKRTFGGASKGKGEIHVTKR